MRHGTFLFVLTVAVTIAAAALSGCTQGGPAPSAEAAAIANATAENMLQAINTNDYAAFTRNFSGPMLAAVNQSRFDEVRDFVQTNYGTYLGRTNASAYERQGYNNFEYKCHFSKQDVTFRLTMNATNLSQVEGEHFV